MLLPAGPSPYAPGQVFDYIFGGTLALGSMSSSNAVDDESKKCEGRRNEENREEGEYRPVRLQ